ncbi:MAG: hypothetical protein FJ189_10300 [Gammaproteobacteria bacterium]|nr:hypothetical protein [Gammaproteobacteria bacterium]
MAKKLSKDEAFAAFAAELVQEFPEEIRDKVAESITGSAKAREGFLRQSEFSRYMDEAKAEREAALAQAQAEIAAARDIADKWNKWGEASYSELSTATERLRQYEQTYGSIDTTAPAKAVPGFSKEEVASLLETKLAERSQQMVAFADVLTDLKLSHRDSFKEPLPTQDLLRFAADKGVADLKQAYEMFTAPRVAERRDEEFAEQLKRAREDGAREAMSTAKLPVGFPRMGNSLIDTINARAAESSGKRDVTADAVADLTARLGSKFTGVA